MHSSLLLQKTTVFYQRIDIVECGKMKKSFLFLCAGVLIGYSLSSYINTPKTLQEPSKVSSQDETQKTDLELEFTYTKSSVSPDEEKSIVGTVRTFETYQAKRSAQAVISMLTEPSNDKERMEYNLLVGNDLNPPFMRMYGTAGTEYQLNWYYITDITKKGEVYLVQVKELRTVYDNSTTDYFANNEDLIIELAQPSIGEYKINKYYRKVPVETESHLTKKYDGFY